MKLEAGILDKLPLALRVEIEENAQRKALTQSELAAKQKRILHELRKYKAPGTRTDLKGRKATSEKPFSQVHATGIVGKLFNESHRQVEKRLAIVDAAEAEPEKFGKLLADMDRTGRVNGAYRRLKNTKQAELIRAEPPPLPGNGPYRVVVADPPWPYEADDEDAAHRGVLPYPTMSIEQICALDVASILHEDSILLSWIPNFHLAQGFHVSVLRAWSLEPKTVLTWPKDRSGRGHWVKGQTEHVVMAVRGKPIITLTDQTTLLRGPFHLLRKNTHSEKPIEFYSFVERLCPASRYCDLFSRYRHNEKWDCHGDQAPRADDLITNTNTMEAAQ